MTDTDRLAALRKKAEGVGFDIYEVHADVYELRQCKSDNPVDTYDDWTLEFCLTERGLNLAETLLAATDPNAPVVISPFEFVKDIKGYYVSPPGKKWVLVLVDEVSE